jgi:putative membrane-bound dehydrogenase-like protein
MIRRTMLAMALAMIPGLLRAAEPVTPLKVLFLGDQGHHVPAERFAQGSPVLASRGINLTYTEKLADLNPENLAKYDALAVYANIDEITPDAAKALLDYVAGGGGFVPLHCASYCFRNNAEIVALIGGQFDHHGTGEFDTKVVDPEHPIMKGLKPFHTWDETYVHSKHNTKDRTVLQTRREGNTDEPWTWVRTHGKGRIFYTAYGHDAVTWGNPGFHDLIERGIRWAANKGDIYDHHPKVATGLKPFTYREAKVPLYLAGGKWGAQGEPIKEMQNPIDPAESLKHLVLPKGFTAHLYAAEPQIYKPIAMCWDHRGRLWIAETIDYPNEIKPRGQGRDQITICEDTDDDGKADKFTVFARNLSIPTSLVCANGGVIVSQAPDMLFLKDTDGDDVADERKTLFTGWSPSDTHAGPSNLRMGFDNWVWGIVGYAGFQGTVGGERHSFRQGFFRFKPDGSKLEFMRNTNNNSWGVGFSEDGLVFGSTANGCPSVFMPIPNRFYEAVRGWSPSVLQMISDSNRFFPVTEKVRQVDFHGGFTAAAGHALYTARNYPPYYWNKTAFVTEPTGHLIATFTLAPKGTDYVSHNSWNLLASDDEWTSPITAEVGPDGNVWTIDWYNFIVQHNPTPEGFTTGKGGAYETPLRDKTHGRIYRLTYGDAKSDGPKSLDPNDADGLVRALSSDNMFWRLQAQRLLVERGKTDVVDKLVALVNDPSVDEVGLNPAAIHALYTLDGLKALDRKFPKAKEAVVKALTHPSAGVRRNAIQVLPRDENTAKILLSAKKDIDPDFQVRLAVLLALAEAPVAHVVALDPDLSVATGGILRGMLLSGDVDGDRGLTDALTAAAAHYDHDFLMNLHSRGFIGPLTGNQAKVLSRVAEHYARGGPSDSIAATVVALVEVDRGIASAVLDGISKGWPKDKTATLNPKAEEALAKLIAKLPPETKSQLVTLAERWGTKSLEKYSAEIAASFLALVKDDTKPEKERVETARQLVEFRKNDVATVKELLELITPRTSPVLAVGLMEAIAKSEAQETGEVIVDRIGTLTPAVRPAAIRALLSRAEWTAALIAGIEGDKLRLADLSLDQSQALAAHPDKAIAERVKKLLEQGGGLPDADRQKVIDELAPLVLKGGDPAKGKLVFEQQCAKCHTHSGAGGKVGPDLTGMAAHPRSELLVHILDPSRSVEGNFVQYSVVTTDGLIYSGLLAAETKTSIELIDAEGKSHTILRDEIDEIAASKKSVMPEGFEKQVPVEGVADLLAFLTQRGKYTPLDIHKVANITTTQGMFFEKTGDAERLIFEDWTPKVVDGVPFLLVNPNGDRAHNAIMLHGPLGKVPPTMPRTVSVPCNLPAKAIHLLSGISGWGYNGGAVDPTVSMIVRLHYSDGTTEDHPLQNGVHFADYIRVVDVPGSKLAFKLRGQQLRYLAIAPKRNEPITAIEFVKGRDQTAPIVMAVTVESAE